MTLTTLGKYEILEKLGEGATAEVFHARDKVLGRDVALKVLKPALVADASAFERFVQEAQAAAGMFHPNIATVLDMAEADGRYFIAMRYFEGRSLDKELKENGSLPWVQVVRMACQLGSALESAHEAGFIHRDVKPSNVICSSTSDFIMTDFGLVRAMMNTGFTSHTGGMIGTPQYMAPEIWNGGQASAASDQYALACVVFEAVTGQSLFGGGSTEEIITKHLIKPPSIADSIRADGPPGLSAVLRNALDKEPAQRYASIGEFTQALADLKPSTTEDLPEVKINHVETKTGDPVPPVLVQQVPVESKLSGLAVITLILGISGATGCLLFVTFPLSFFAILCGHVALNEIKKGQGKIRGKTQAVIGLILGYLTIIMGCIFFFIYYYGDSIMQSLGF